MGLDSLKQQIGELKNATTGYITGNPTKAAAIGAASAAVIGGGVALAVSSRKKSRRKRKKSTYRNVRKTSRKHRHRRRTPRTAGKRKDRSHKRIRYTKRGQPYIILKSGKARFIKSSSARRSHKRKGGRY